MIFFADNAVVTTTPAPLPTTAVTTAPFEEPCINGKIVQYCGTACPLTCDNYRNPPGCVDECVIGCFCPHGLVELGDICVSPTSCPGELLSFITQVLQDIPLSLSSS